VIDRDTPPDVRELLQQRALGRVGAFGWPPDRVAPLWDGPVTVQVPDF